SARLDPRRRAARREPEEDRLDLIARGVPRRTDPVGRDGVAKLAELRLGRTHRPDADDLGAELLAAEARVPVRLGSAQPVVDVERGDPVAELPQAAPQARRVGAARDQAGHLAAEIDQLVAADVLLDAREEGHRRSVADVAVPGE